jgi:hypothetical protein
MAVGMPNPTEATTDAERAMCDCVACLKARGAAITPTAAVHGYSSIPRNGWRPRRTTDAADLTAPTFGVELEVDGPGRPADLPGEPPYGVPEHDRWAARNRRHVAEVRARHLTTDEAAACANPRGHWLPSQDGSLRNGVEFKGQPATLRWYTGNRAHLAQMFRALIHGGFRAHDAGTAGLHTNIGIDAFQGADGRVDADHLYRFATLWVTNPRFTTRLSRRTHDSLRWAVFTGTLTDPAFRHEWANTIARDGYAYCDHTQALNSSHPGRLEVRSPRGTLRLDTFMATIQWVAAAVEFTRDSANRPTPADFIAYVKANRATYPDFHTYAAMRMPGRFV